MALVPVPPDMPGKQRANGAGFTSSFLLPDNRPFSLLGGAQVAHQPRRPFGIAAAVTRNCAVCIRTWSYGA